MDAGPCSNKLIKEISERIDRKEGVLINQSHYLTGLYNLYKNNK